MENMDTGYTDKGSNVPTSWGDWNTSYVNLNYHHHQMNHSLNDSISSFCGSDFSSPGPSPLRSLSGSSTTSVQSDSFTSSNVMYDGSWEEQVNFSVPYNQTNCVNDQDEMRFGPDDNEYLFDELDYRDPSRHYLTVRKNTRGRRGRCFQNMQSSGFSISVSQSQTSLSNMKSIKPRTVYKRDSTGEVKVDEPLDDWGNLHIADDKDDGRAAKCCRAY